MADGGAGAVAAGEIVGRAGLFGAVGEAEAGFDLVAAVFAVDEFGGAFDGDAGFGEVVDEEALVLVLGEDEHEREGAEALAEGAEFDVADVFAFDPEVYGIELVASADDFVGDAELAVELERAGVDDEGARGGARFGDFVDDADADAEAREPEGEVEAGGAGTDD